VLASVKPMGPPKVDIPLREHFEGRIASVEKKIDDWVKLWREERAKGLQEISQRAEDLEKRVNERAAAQERAIDKAEGAVSERLRGMNEFRESLRDQSATLATRKEMELNITSLETRLHNMELWVANMQGRMLVLAGVWGAILIVLSVMLNYAIRKAFE